MGVYSKQELKQLSPESWAKMIEIHKNDLQKYYMTSEYPNRKRDIDESIENIHILMTVQDEEKERLERMDVKY